jgi:hypothetical protein
VFYKLDTPSQRQKFVVVGDKFMNTGVCKGLDARPWREFYQDAIHESDLKKLPERITDAESALVIRMRELFYTSGEKFEEQDSLDDAMCILRALRSSLKRLPSAIQSTSNRGDLRSA